MPQPSLCCIILQVVLLNRPMENSSVLTAQGIVKEYSTAAGPLRILDGITLAANRGESLAIIGPSGSGKSTLLNILGTLDTPTSGEVLIDGESISKLNEKQLAETRNKKLGFVFQAHYLLPQCTVLENVLVPTLPLGGAAPTDRAKKLLARVGLGERLQHQPNALSGGEKQRVAVVRALINQPRVLLADEPTGALDQQSAATLGELLVELNREQNIALIVVTHSLDLARRMSKIYELQQGKLLEVTGKI